MTRTAYLQVRTNMQYRNEVFREGVKRLGYEINLGTTKHPLPGDILITWNRYGTLDKAACIFEEVGLPVIVAENSYLDMKNCKKAFAMSLNKHNGGGRWPLPEGHRSLLLNIDLKPWKMKGKHVLILPQRGIGVPPVAMPKRWHLSVEKRLKEWGVPFHTRLHPELLKKDTKGNEKHPLEQDLEKAYAAVVWASSAGIKAMLAGVPTFYEFPDWIGGNPAACFGIDPLLDGRPDHVHSLMGSRMQMLEKIAWAQWSGEEVRTGEPIKRLVDLHYGV